MSKLVRHTVVEQLAETIERLVGGIHRAAGPTRRLGDTAAGFVASEHQLAVARRKLFQAAGERNMALVDFGCHLARRMRDGSEHFVVKHNLRASKLLPRVADAPPGNLARPSDEIRRSEERRVGKE